MPTFRGVTVHVVGNEGPLEEWATHEFPHSRTVSCYVESKANMRFTIELQGITPFKKEYYSDMKVPQEERGGESKQEVSRTEPGPSRVTDDLMDASEDEPPPFHLLASLYLDGNRETERRVIVYLDPGHSQFVQNKGWADLRTTWVEGRDGRAYKRSWFFKERDIESLFDKLLISKKQMTQEASDDDFQKQLCAAMDALEVGDTAQTGSGSNAGTPQHGEILVSIQRVTLGDERTSTNYRPSRTDSDGRKGADNELMHSTSHGERERLPKRDVPVVEYKPYVRDEEPFAKFRFFYRSQEQLKAFDFPNFQVRQTTTTKSEASINMRDLRNDIAALSSLGDAAHGASYQSSGNPSNSSTSPGRDRNHNGKRNRSSSRERSADENPFSKYQSRNGFPFIESLRPSAVGRDTRSVINAPAGSSASGKKRRSS